MYKVCQRRLRCFYPKRTFLCTNPVFCIMHVLKIVAHSATHTIFYTNVRAYNVHAQRPGSQSVIILNRKSFILEQQERIKLGFSRGILVHPYGLYLWKKEKFQKNWGRSCQQISSCPFNPKNRLGFRGPNQSRVTPRPSPSTGIAGTYTRSSSDSNVGL